MHDYLPHGHCYFWDPGLVWLNAISDLLIAAAYYSIPLLLYYVIRRRPDFRFRGLILMFAAFILACGTTHALAVWNIWHTAYWLDGFVKALTAGLSLATVIATVKLAPLALKVMTPEQTEESNRKLMAAQEKLRHLAGSERLSSEARLRSYFESASQGILAVDRQGMLVLVNRKMEEMFGYTRLEMLGQPLSILIPERYRNAHAVHRHDFFAEPRVRTMSKVGMKLSGRRKDGSQFPVEIGLSYVESDDGILALGLVSDITEQRRLAQQLESATEELRRSNSDLEQFAYVASHDLQEPLRMISGYLSLLERRDGVNLDQDAREFIQFAVDGSQRMKALIQDLLSFSRAGRNAIESQDVEAGTILQNALENLQAAIEDTHAEVTSDTLPTIHADASLMTHVFQNLIGNAIKFHTSDAPKVHISAEARDGEWAFFIRDNGIGIEHRHQERIFRIFERLHSAEHYPGSGVGLAISKKIVERHGGRMWVISQPGEGSTFSFALPLKTAEFPGREESHGVPT
ncbi:MAG TPA: ATP-binding protein [Bryobacteraceae bacterium]|nr:ATP-binding protein [Bryobacteraceae bacterium]